MEAVQNYFVMVESVLMDYTPYISVAVSIILSVGAGLLVFWGKFASAQTEIKNLKDRLDKAEAKLTDACEKLAKEEGRGERDRAHDDLVKRESPISLTDKGKALLLDSGGQAYIEANKSALIEAIRAKTPTSAYDVQEMAKQVIQEKSSSPEFVPIKNYLYSEGLDLERAVTVLGIHLRDEAFPVLGFNPNDIDSTPTPSPESSSGE